MYMESNILNITELYCYADKMYFPTRLDKTTRLYCTAQYINYKYADLVIGLLLFANPGIIYKHDIDSINYLKHYGATLFDSALDKRFINYKVK